VLDGMPCFVAMIMVVIDFTAVMQHILIIHTADYTSDSRPLCISVLRGQKYGIWNVKL